MSIMSASQATFNKPSKRSSKPSTSTEESPEDKEKPHKSFTLLMDTHLFELENKDDFERILNAADNRIVMIEFFAHWCGPCKVLTAKLIEIADKYNGKLLIVKIDVDRFEGLALKYNVSAIPTFIIMNKKRVVEQFANSNVEILEKTVEKFVGKPEAGEE